MTEKKIKLKKHTIAPASNSKKKCSSIKSFNGDPKYKNKVIKAKANVEVSKTISRLRKHSKLTKKEIANKIHIKKSEFIKIEKSKNISVYTLIQIADACGGDINIEVVFPKTIK